MHNWPDLEIGKFAIRAGPFFAASAHIILDVSRPTVVNPQNSLA
jgi:hypothetical protein